MIKKIVFLLESEKGKLALERELHGHQRSDNVLLS